MQLAAHVVETGRALVLHGLIVIVASKSRVQRGPEAAAIPARLVEHRLRMAHFARLAAGSHFLLQARSTPRTATISLIVEDYLSTLFLKPVDQQARTVWIVLIQTGSTASERHVWRARQGLVRQHSSQPTSVIIGCRLLMCAFYAF